MFDKHTFIKAFLLTTIFMLGFLTNNVYSEITTEQPANINTGKNVETTNGYTDEVSSPSDWVSEKQIGVYSKSVILDIKDAQWSTFTDTHSMEPVLSSRANAIQIVPKNPDQIKVGDIISYESEYADGFIIHRVIEKGEDDKGTYFIAKGDNNEKEDPGKIRFNQIRRVVVAIVY